MTVGSIPCPGRCGGAIHLEISGVLFGAQSEIHVTPNTLDVRRHAACMSPNGGGESLDVAA